MPPVTQQNNYRKEHMLSWSQTILNYSFLGKS